MESAYWHSRKRASMAMARAASCAEARLIHYELAGRYSRKADQSEIPKLEVIDAPPMEAYASCVAQFVGHPRQPIRPAPSAAEQPQAESPVGTYLLRVPKSFSGAGACFEAEFTAQLRRYTP